MSDRQTDVDSASLASHASSGAPEESSGLDEQYPNQWDCRISSVVNAPRLQA